MTEPPPPQPSPPIFIGNQSFGHQGHEFVPSTADDAVTISKQKIVERDAKSARWRQNFGFGTVLLLGVAAFVVSSYLSVWGEEDVKGWAQGVFAGVLGAILGALAGYVTGNKTA